MVDALGFAVTVVVCVFLGIALDERLGTTPLFIILLMFLGIASGIWGAIRRTLKKR